MAKRISKRTREQAAVLCSATASNDYNWVQSIHAANASLPAQRLASCAWDEAARRRGFRAGDAPTIAAAFAGALLCWREAHSLLMCEWAP